MLSNGVCKAIVGTVGYACAVQSGFPFCLIVASAYLLQSVLAEFGIVQRRKQIVPHSLLMMSGLLSAVAAVALELPLISLFALLSYCAAVGRWWWIRSLSSTSPSIVVQAGLCIVLTGATLFTVISMLTPAPWVAYALAVWAGLVPLLARWATGRGRWKGLLMQEDCSRHQHRRWQWATCAAVWVLALVVMPQSPLREHHSWSFGIASVALVLFSACRLQGRMSSKALVSRNGVRAAAAALMTSVIVSVLVSHLQGERIEEGGMTKLTCATALCAALASVASTVVCRGEVPSDSDSEGSDGKIGGRTATHDRWGLDPAAMFASSTHSSDHSSHNSDRHTAAAPLLRLTIDVARHLLQNPRERRLFLFFLLTLLFMVVELVVGMEANSLGLVSDAFHMLLDGASIAIGLCAAYMQRWGHTRRHPFGFAGYEVLSGFTNGVLLVVVALFLFVESLHRLFSPPEVDSTHLMFVAVSGLLVNVVGVLFFHDAHHHHHGHSHQEHGGGGCGGHHHHHDHNLRGVYLHILADLLGSIGVIGSTFVVKTTGWMAADPLCSAVLSLVILASAAPLLQETSAVLLGRDPSSSGSDKNGVLLTLRVGAAQKVRCRRVVFGLTGAAVTGTDLLDLR